MFLSPYLISWYVPKYLSNSSTLLHFSMTLKRKDWNSNARKWMAEDLSVEPLFVFQWNRPIPSGLNQKVLWGHTLSHMSAPNKLLIIGSQCTKFSAFHPWIPVDTSHWRVLKQWQRYPHFIIITDVFVTIFFLVAVSVRAVERLRPSIGFRRNLLPCRHCLPESHICSFGRGRCKKTKQSFGWGHEIMQARRSNKAFRIQQSSFGSKNLQAKFHNLWRCSAGVDPLLGIVQNQVLYLVVPHQLPEYYPTITGDDTDGFWQ